MNPMNPVARSGVLALVLLLAACGGSEPAHSDAQGHGGESAEAMAKGPHGGRLLEKDGIGVEVTIYETGVEPQFRVYLYRDDKPLPPDVPASTDSLATRGLAAVVLVATAALAVWIARLGG